MEDALVRVVDLCKVYNPGENEVRALDNDHCILFIRGELPMMDRKYDILKHPSLKLTEDGGAAPYIHCPGLTYALEDLPLSTDSWESIEIIE